MKNKEEIIYRPFTMVGVLFVCFGFGVLFVLFLIKKRARFLFETAC